MERKTTRSERLAMAFFPGFFDMVAKDRGMWFEDDLHRERMLAWGARKAFLIRWLRSRMEEQLTERQRMVIEYIHFEGLSHQESGARLGVSASTSCRDGQKALRILKRAAEEDQSWGPKPGWKDARE